VLAGAVAFLMLAGAASAEAYWAASASATATVRAADPSVQLAGTAGLTTTYTSTSTGPVIAPLTLTATGSVPLQLSLASSSTNAALTGAIRLRTWVRVGTGCGASIPPSGVTTSTLAAPQLPAGATSLTGPASVVVCAATDVASGYTTYAGQATTVTLTLTGQVAGTTWAGTANGSFTQTLSASAPSFSCTTVTGQVTISWANTPTANTGTIYRSRVNGVLPGGLADRSYYYREYSNQGWMGTELPAAAGVYPWVIDQTTNGVPTVAYSGQIEVYWFAAWNAWGLRCVP